MMAELWRVYRVAKLLDVSKKRIYQMVQEGKIDAVRLGPRSMRITRESIDQFISRGRKENRANLGLVEDARMGMRRMLGRRTTRPGA